MAEDKIVIEEHMDEHMLRNNFTILVEYPLPLKNRTGSVYD